MNPSGQSPDLNPNEQFCDELEWGLHTRFLFPKVTDPSNALIAERAQILSPQAFIEEWTTAQWN